MRRQLVSDVENRLSAQVSLQRGPIRVGCPSPLTPPPSILLGTAIMRSAPST
jgi:hypothetical protein